MTDRVLSEVQAAEVGFIPRLHGVALPGKGCSCEIREALHVLQPLRWCCVDCLIHHERDAREEQHHTYMWREPAIIE